MPDITLTPWARDLLATQYANMQACVRCGQCLPACPTYAVSLLEQEGPRGRIAMARALVEGHLAVTPDLQAHWESCILCDGCSAACPAGVHMEPLGQTLRAAVNESRGGIAASPAVKAALRWVLPDLGVMRDIVGLGRLVQRIGLMALGRRIGLLKALGVDDLAALLPPGDVEPLVPAGQVWEPVGEHRATVALLAGCFMSTVLADTDRATARVLAANGCRVVVPQGQGCCGSLHAHHGDLDGARALARRNIDAFEAMKVDAIVVNAAGCTNTMKHYDRFLGDDPEYTDRAKALMAKVRDFTEYLVELGPRQPGRVVDWRVTFQEPCHLAHAQGIRTAPHDLLRAVPGLQLTEMQEPALCCGAGALYNVEQPETSDALRERKLQHAAATQADVIVTSNPGCYVQLARGLRERGSHMRVMHIADVLDTAYDE